MSGREPHEIIRENVSKWMWHGATAFDQDADPAGETLAALDALVAHVNELQREHDGLRHQRDFWEQRYETQHRTVHRLEDARDAERARAVPPRDEESSGWDACYCDRTFHDECPRDAVELLAELGRGDDTVSAERDRLCIAGGCWCPDEMTLGTLRVMGHTPSCTQARIGWEANQRHMSEIERQRREDELAGRQLREAAARVLAGGAPDA